MNCGKLSEKKYIIYVYLCVISQIHIFRLFILDYNPLFCLNNRAADWNLNEPTWTGRLRMVSNGNALIVKLEDKTSGQLFANCPVEAYPGVAIESVSDSSRYFVLRIQNDNGQTAFIGLGFGDRSDSFDMNVALQDHFKFVKNQDLIEKEKSDPKPQLDLGFKDGQTIKINMKITVNIIFIFFASDLISSSLLYLFVTLFFVLNSHTTFIYIYHCRKKMVMKE